jgi:Tfp pilus assembly protein PilX
MNPTVSRLNGLISLLVEAVLREMEEEAVAPAPTQSKASCECTAGSNCEHGDKTTSHARISGVANDIAPRRIPCPR